MNKKIYEILEFQKIREELASFATSDPAKEKCLQIDTQTDMEIIQKLLDETSCAKNRVINNPIPSFSNVCKMETTIETLEHDGILTCSEFMKIYRMLEVVERIKKYGCREIEEEKRDLLDPIFNRLEYFNKMKAEIKRCISGENSISDNASVKLGKIRDKLKGIDAAIQSKMHSLATGSMRKFLSDTFIVERDNSYCLAVRYNCKNSVKGTIHGESGTGSTVYIEPDSVARMAKEKRDLQMEEKMEEAIILAELSSYVAENVKGLKKDYQSLVELDFIFAKAYLSIEMNATTPILNKKGIINFINARHPLIPKDKVVASTITIGKNYNQLVVTGPNTGGKTITLKTTGILTMMGQCGLHISADEESELAIFEEVYADIGDEQSIEQSLSFFSAHMMTIVNILSVANSKSLVLIDELGAGTDPLEGACLAIAILEKLHLSNITTLATTHYSEIKTYAQTTTGVENACCEFDVNTLSPTYKLIIGNIGTSHAFAISKKIGLTDEILSKAEEKMELFSKQ